MLFQPVTWELFTFETTIVLVCASLWHRNEAGMGKDAGITVCEDFGILHAESMVKAELVDVFVSGILEKGKRRRRMVWA